MTTRSTRPALLAALLLLMSGGPLHATNAGTPLNPSAVTYQAQVKLNGAPVTGVYDFQFRLFDGPTNGNQIGTTELLNDIPLANGLLSTVLDFAPTLPFDGFERYLEIGVRPGGDNGPYTVLTPRQALTPAAYASLALEAETSYSAAPNSVNSTGIVDGAILSADIADGTIGAADVNATQIQRRIGLACEAGNAISAVASDGTTTCVPVGGGGGGLVDGSVTTPKLADNAVTAIKLASGSVDASKIVNGSVTSAAIADGSIGAGELALGAVGSNAIADGSIGSADIDASAVQRRVTGTCTAGNAIRTVNSDGTVVCQAAAGAGWNLTGNAGTSPGTSFVGTTDANDLVLRANNQQVARFGNPSGFPNTVIGHSGNVVGPGVFGAFIAGGGTGQDANIVYDSFGVVGGGVGNQVGANDGNANNQQMSVIGGGKNNSIAGSAATVAGGIGNFASGENATVGGGSANKAGANAAVVPGGASNYAGGDFSFAAGRFALVRPRLDANDPQTCLQDGTCGDEGTFVWADSLGGTLSSSGPHQFLARAAGGFMLNSDHLENAVWDDFVLGTRAEGAGGDADLDIALRTRSGQVGRLFVADASGYMSLSANSIALNAPSFALNASPLVAGRFLNTSTNAYLSTGGTWTNASSRALKDVLGAVDVGSVLDAVLALPLTSWHYKAEPASVHIGPMAEDFRAAFGLGADAEHIATVDADGVALAAIQGLSRKLEAENRALRERLERIERRLGTADARASGE